jgi:hypothetical protein
MIYKDYNINISNIKSMLNAHQKKIRSIIRKNHDGILYHDKELPDVVNTLIINIYKSSEKDVDNNDVHTFIAQYLHFNKKEKKYYFNLLPRKTRKRKIIRH